MLPLVILPATHPDETKFGTWQAGVSPVLARTLNLDLYEVDFGEQVWYNAQNRQIAVDQIRRMTRQSVILVGFSKSGLGAFNMALEYPGLAQQVVIFDAPAATLEFPKWETAVFYRNKAQWLADLPLNRCPEFAALRPRTELILACGESFRADMQRLSRKLRSLGLEHRLLDDQWPHRWDSGWLEVSILSLLPAH